MVHSHQFRLPRGFLLRIKEALNRAGGQRMSEGPSRRLDVVGRDTGDYVCDEGNRTASPHAGLSQGASVDPRTDWTVGRGSILAVKWIEWGAVRQRSVGSRKGTTTIRLCSKNHINQALRDDTSLVSTENCAFRNRRSWLSEHYGVKSSRGGRVDGEGRDVLTSLQNPNMIAMMVLTRWRHVSNDSCERIELGCSASMVWRTLFDTMNMDRPTHVSEW